MKEIIKIDHNTKFNNQVHYFNNCNLMLQTEILLFSFNNKIIFIIHYFKKKLVQHKYSKRIIFLNSIIHVRLKY